jgi:hypothetical protein
MLKTRNIGAYRDLLARRISSGFVDSRKSLRPYLVKRTISTLLRDRKDEEKAKMKGK